MNLSSLIGRKRTWWTMQFLSDTIQFLKPSYVSWQLFSQPLYQPFWKFYSSSYQIERTWNHCWPVIYPQNEGLQILLGDSLISRFSFQCMNFFHPLSSFHLKRLHFIHPYFKTSLIHSLQRTNKIITPDI